MLEKLDTIDWSRLTHAYGEASDVPDIIRALTSEDEEMREEALSELHGNIWHQGTVYEATAYAVPFLLELLEAPSVAGKSSILALLQSIAEGSSYLYVHQSTDHNYNKRKSQEFADQLTRELDFVQRAHDAVEAGTPVYLNLLADASRKTREWALYTLAVCVGRADEIESELWGRFVSQEETKLKAAMLLCLRDLWRYQRQPASAMPGEAQYRSMKEVMLAVRESPLVRFSAALSLVGWLDGEDREAAFSLVESLAAESWQDFSSLPWSVLDGDISAITAGFEHLPELRLRFQLGLLQNPDKKIRISAIYTLDDLCREQRATAAQVAPILGTLLRDPAPEVRRWAAKTLSQFGAAARPATEPLLAALHDSNSDVRGAAAIALARLGEQQAVTRIRELLYHHQTSFQALEALQRFGPLAADAIPDLLALIPSPTDGLEPVNLILAIGEIDNAGEASLKEMADLLAGPYALTALYVLGSWGTAAQPVMAELIAALDSREEMAACNAVIALGRLGPAAATAAPRLRQLLEDRDPLLRTCSAIALWQIERSELTVPLLIGIIEQELNHHTHDLQYACSTAAEYLGEIGSEATSAAPVLRRALQHNNFFVRIHAACSLWHITRNPEEVLAIFLEELKPHGASAEIMGCLAEMGSQASAAIPELRRIIESEARVVEIASTDDWIEQDEEFRELAIKTLQAILAD